MKLLTPNWRDALCRNVTFRKYDFNTRKFPPITARRGFSTARLDGQFSVTPGPNAQYLVIYSSEADRQASTTYESEEKAYARVRGLSEPAGPDPRAVHTATGEVTLEIVSLTGSTGMTSMIGDTPVPIPEAAGPRPQAATPAPAPEPTTADFDYRRMIDAALKAGDVELALDLAERAERSGHPGTRAWLADRLQAKTP